MVDAERERLSEEESAEQEAMSELYDAVEKQPEQHLTPWENLPRSLQAEQLMRIWVLFFASVCLGFIVLTVAIVVLALLFFSTIPREWLIACDPDVIGQVFLVLGLAVFFTGSCLAFVLLFHRFGGRS